MRATTRLCLLLAALSVAACGDDDDSDDARSTASNPSAATDGGVTDAAFERTVDIETQTLRFDPDVIRARPGERLRIVLRNDGLIEHNIEFVLGNGMLLRIPENVGRNETGELLLTVPAAGTYEFYCPVNGHRAAGMTGMLIVEATP